VAVTGVCALATGARALVAVDTPVVPALVTAVVALVVELTDEVAAAVAGAAVSVTADTTGAVTLASVAGAAGSAAGAGGGTSAAGDVAWPAVPAGGVRAEGSVGAAGGVGTGGGGGGVSSAGAAAWADVAVAGLVAELTTDPTTLVTGLAAVEAADEAGPVTAETADETVGRAGGWSPVAAWACLERISRRKIIPAAAIANCAARKATRRAIGCDIDSSQLPGNSRLPSGCRAVRFHESPGSTRRPLQIRHSVRSSPYTMVTIQTSGAYAAR
jgi:hypothetical protein